MHLSSLHIFAKQTDANEQLLGYRYQELKTLQTWLYNRVNRIDEDIFCEYQEDIFQRDPLKKTSKFRQIKLYSSKAFSFTSVEIKKALFNFLMHFADPEYLFDEVVFSFETNTSVAREYAGNEAKLLAEWVKEQGQMEDDLVSRCTKKIKELLDGYIEDGVKALATTPEGKKEAEEAHLAYQNLPQETWRNFIKSIRWEFSELSANEAKEIVVRSIQTLISELPFPIGRDESENVFARLQREVGERSVATNPSDRCLTNGLMDELLLSMSEGEDQDYLRAYQSWSQLEPTSEFRVGEFYQVLHSAKHCRRNVYLKDHTTFWVQTLDQFVKLADILETCKREAIYERLWLIQRLTFDMNLDHFVSNNLTGEEETARSYFSEFEKFTESQAIEDCLNLLTTICTSQKLGQIELTESEVKDWFERLGLFIDSQIQTCDEENEKCRLLETRAFYLFEKMNLFDPTLSSQDALGRFREILPLLPSAKLYSVSQLASRINSIIELLLKLGRSVESVQPFEEFSISLIPFIDQRESNFSKAKYFITKGHIYLSSKDNKGILMALNFFHMAKDLLHQDETIEGFIICLLGISELYSLLGMNLAAKYYGLCGAWMAIQKNNPRLFRRIADSNAMIFQSDFKQGAWISAFDSFKDYVTSRILFDVNELDYEKDGIFRQCLSEVASILVWSPRIAPDTDTYIQYQKQMMNEFYTKHLSKLEEASSSMAEANRFEFLQSKLDDAPISDLGATRVISWKTFGSIWSVSFPNEYHNNSIGEEFCAMAQIILVEYALNGVDLHLIKTKVEIEVEITDAFKAPLQLPSNSRFLWRVFLPVFNRGNQQQNSMHFSNLAVSCKTILDEMSLLPCRVFDSHFWELFQKSDLASKTVSVNSYQRMYQVLRTKEKFEESHRSKFKPAKSKLDIPEHPSLAWNDLVSEFYDLGKSLKRIESRYENSLIPIQRTFERIKNEPLFQIKITKLRAEGWLDWQILMALMCHVLNLKTGFMIQDRSFDSEDARREAWHEMFFALKDKDENAEDPHILIPIEHLLTDEFDFQVRTVPFNVLSSFVLEKKSHFPEFDAIRNFLVEKFNFGSDDVPSASPLKDLKIGH